MYEENYGLTKEKFLTQNGFDSEDEFIEFLTLDYLRNKYYEEYIASQISDEEIEKYYNENVFAPINVEHILVRIPSEVNDDAALSRLIVGGHTFEMIDAVKSVYDFSLFNLYYSGKIINESFDTADFISYCENNGIQSLSCAAAYFTPVSAEELSHSSLYKFVFTINDENAAKAAFDLGADAVGTDEIK